MANGQTKLERDLAKARKLKAVPSAEARLREFLFWLKSARDEGLTTADAMTLVSLIPAARSTRIGGQVIAKFGPAVAEKIVEAARIVGNIGAVGSIAGHGSKAVEALAEGDLKTAALEGLFAKLGAAGRAAAAKQTAEEAVETVTPAATEAAETLVKEVVAKPVEKTAKQLAARARKTELQRGRRDVAREVAKEAAKAPPEAVELVKRLAARTAPAAKAAAKPTEEVIERAAQVARTLPRLGEEAAETAEIAAGRMKFAQRAKELGKAVDEKTLEAIDTVGIAHRRTTLALKTLQGAIQEGGAVTPEVEQVLKFLNTSLDEGVETLKIARTGTGKALFKSAKDALAQAKALDEVGATALALITRYGLLAGGAAALSATGDTNEERIGRAVLGAVGVGAGLKLVGKAAQLGIKGVGGRVQDFQYFAMLASPGPIGRATLGSLSGTLVGALDRLAEGMTHIGTPKASLKFKQAAAILREATVHGPKEYINALLSPKTPTSELIGLTIRGPILGLPARLINAANAPAVRALKAGGYSENDALRLTLTGEPATAVGRWALEPFETRFGPTSQAIARTIVPFPRVMIQAAEQAFEPIRAGLTGRERLARGLVRFGGGTALGAAAEPFVPTGTETTAGAAVGPLVVPANVGFAFRRSQRLGEPLAQSLQEAFGRALAPTVAAGTLPDIKRVADFPRSLAARQVPGFFRDIARARDPAFAREAGSTELFKETLDPTTAFFGRVFEKLPGARETLPEVPEPVDIFGRPRVEEGRTGLPAPLERALFAPGRTGGEFGLPPTVSPGPLRDIFVRSGEDLPTAPIVSETEEAAFGPEGPTREQRAGLLRLKGMSLQRDLNRFLKFAERSPRWQALSKPEQAAILKNVISDIRKQTAEGLR